MINIIFHSHTKTFDNEAGRASGHNDVALSLAGIEEAKKLGKKYKNANFAAIFCSDLQRAYKTAELAFGNRFPIIKDDRLRECDYGSFTLQSKHIIKAERSKRIIDPFPGGESYTQVVSRVKSFLADLLKDYDGKKVMIIGHAGTRIGLEYWLNNKSIEAILSNIGKDAAGIKYELIELYPLRIDSQPLD